MKIWQKYSALVRVVKLDHMIQPVPPGHDFYHAFAVAQYARMISEDEHVGELAWVAGICHNADRLCRIRQANLPSVLANYMGCAGLTLEDTDIVLEAIAEHSKKNDDRDSSVTVALKDGDRLANLDATHLVRSGQFRPEIPVFDPRFILNRDPTATFKDPKTHLHNIYSTLEWESWLRLPKAKELGREKCSQLREYIRRLEEELSFIGLNPCPPELFME